jgi:hypothetical protein
VWPRFQMTRGARNRGHCLPVGARNEAAILFLEGENIVPPSQNRHVCDALVMALFHIASQSVA